MQKYKLVLIVGLVVIVFFGGFFSGDTYQESKSKKIMEGFRQRQVERDSIITAYESAFEDMKAEADTLRSERDFYRAEVDGTLVVLKGLTQPQVKDETIEEALEWIEHYNDSLQSFSF